MSPLQGRLSVSLSFSLCLRPVLSSFMDRVEFLAASNYSWSLPGQMPELHGWLYEHWQLLDTLDT